MSLKVPSIFTLRWVEIRSRQHWMGEGRVVKFPSNESFHVLKVLKSYKSLDTGKIPGRSHQPRVFAGKNCSILHSHVRLQVPSSHNRRTKSLDSKTCKFMWFHHISSKPLAIQSSAKPLVIQSSASLLPSLSPSPYDLLYTSQLTVPNFAHRPTSVAAVDVKCGP